MSLPTFLSQTIADPNNPHMKLYVRGFDFDERLLGVAFLDISIYTTTITTLKNLIILGDAVRSIWFVAFQVRILPLLLSDSPARRKLMSSTGGSVQARAPW